MAETTTQNVYTQTRLPAWIQPYYDRLAQEAQGVALQGYPTYDAPRVAGLSPMETASWQGFGALGTGAGPWEQQMAGQTVAGGIGQLNPLLQQAQGAMGRSYYDMSGVAGAYDPLSQRMFDYSNYYLQNMGRGAEQAGAAAGKFGDVEQAAGQPMMAAGRDWTEYMDPYAQNVTDIAKRKAIESGRMLRSQLGSDAAAAGAFGGYRHGLQEGQLNRDLAQQLSDLDVQGLERGYERGIGLFEGDRAAQQQANLQRIQALTGGLGALSTQGDLWGQALGGQQRAFDFAQQGLAGRGSALSAANQLYGEGLGRSMQGIGMLGGMGMDLGSLGAQSQQMLMDRLSAMEGAGMRQRGYEQGVMDIGYQDFLRQRDWPKEQLSWFGSILGGFPHQSMSNTNMSTAQQAPSLWQGALGAGIGGLGMYNALQQ